VSELLVKSATGRDMKKGITATVIGGAVLLAVLIYTQISIFVVPPIGALPEGRTLIISRVGTMDFVDSPDGMCEKMQGGVSLLCRGMTLGTVANKTTIFLRLPYNETLYLISTGGKTYER
jgi:hypothetical protein